MSWPGNDFYEGARVTDDGVKAAATSAMSNVTGTAGAYLTPDCRYQPPAEYRDWLEVVEDKRIGLRLGTPFVWDGTRVA